MPPPDTKETPEQIADRIAYKYLDKTAGSAKLKSDILSALRNERERCARWAESWEHEDKVNPARPIARAIREGRQQ